MMSQSICLLLVMVVVLFPVAVNTAGTKNPTITQVPYVVFKSAIHRPEYEFVKKKTAKFVYEDDGSCGIWNEENYTAAIDQQYAQLPSFECVEDFEKWATEMQNPYDVCGDPYYKLRKHCTLAHAFDNKPADQSDIVAGDKQDVAIVLFDGCVVCDFGELQKIEDLKIKGPKNEATINRQVTHDFHAVRGEIWISYPWKEGSRFTSCKADTYESDHFSFYNVKQGKGLSKSNQTGTIFLVATLYQRYCMGLFSADPMPEIYEGVKVHVKHNCNLKNTEETLEFPLRNIVPKEHPNHVAEMRGLQFGLHNNTMVKYQFRPNGTAVNEPSESTFWDSLY